MASKSRNEAGLRLSFCQAAHLQTLEGNPLDAEDLVMFEMFDREDWSDEKRRAYILDQALRFKATTAAE